MKKKLLVTGCSGFIGFHLCKSLLDDGFIIYGVDNMNEYYDKKLKASRLKILLKSNNFKIAEIDISDYNSLNNVFIGFKPDKVVNLAAQAGVRYSLVNPHSYIDSNIKGFMNILECCRHHAVKGLIYASSSSVYGGNKKIPFSVNDNTDNPISIYAATKKSNELMANSYSQLYGLHTTGLRFFKVYGPWGRPDMAMYIFADKIMLGEKLPVFNNGFMKRDFTYIDDIISGIRSAISKNYSCEIFNIGNNNSEDLMKVIRLIEKSLGKKADIQFLGMQPGDVEATFADIDHTERKLDYKPRVSIEVGLPKFINWYREYSLK